MDHEEPGLAATGMGIHVELAVGKPPFVRFHLCLDSAEHSHGAVVAEQLLVTMCARIAFARVHIEVVRAAQELPHAEQEQLRALVARPIARGELIFLDELLRRESADLVGAQASEGHDIRGRV